MSRSGNRIQVGTIRTCLLQKSRSSLGKCRRDMVVAILFFQRRNVRWGTQGQSSLSERSCCSSSRQCSRSSCVDRFVWSAGSMCRARTRTFVQDTKYHHRLEDSSDPWGIRRRYDIPWGKDNQANNRCIRRLASQP